MSTCAHKNIEIIKLLLKNKDINIDIQDNYKNTALHYANEDIKKLLEEHNKKQLLKNDFELINNNIMNVYITQEMINNKEFKINFK